MNKKYLVLPVLVSLMLTGCGNTVSGTDQNKAQKYYQYLPVCQCISGTNSLTEEQFALLDSEFYSRAENYEQTMYHVVGKNSYMNEIYYHFQDTLVAWQNYSPMAYVLHEHQGEIGMNPILLMRGVLEGDSNPETEYDNYTEHIFCSKKESDKESHQEEWTSPTEIYSGTAEDFIRKMFSPYADSENLQIGHTSDNMYYVYLIEIQEDIECYAFYFYPDADGIFRQASMDYLRYGGNELVSCLNDSTLKTNACMAGESHAEEKDMLLKSILDIPPSQEKAGTYENYILSVSGFAREYISDTAGKIAELKHKTYQLQKPQE